MAKKKDCPTKGHKRKFDKKVFTLKAIEKKKTDANASKAASKKRGCRVRVLETKCGNAVYQRCTK